MVSSQTTLPVVSECLGQEWGLDHNNRDIQGGKNHYREYIDKFHHVNHIRVGITVTENGMQLEQEILLIGKLLWIIILSDNLGIALATIAIGNSQHCHIPNMGVKGLSQDSYSV